MEDTLGVTKDIKEFLAIVKLKRPNLEMRSWDFWESSVRIPK